MATHVLPSGLQNIPFLFSPKLSLPPPVVFSDKTPTRLTLASFFLPRLSFSPNSFLSPSHALSLQRSISLSSQKYGQGAIDSVGGSLMEMHQLDGFIACGNGGERLPNRPIMLAAMGRTWESRGSPVSPAVLQPSWVPTSSS